MWASYSHTAKSINPKSINVQNSVIRLSDEESTDFSSESAAYVNRFTIAVPGGNQPTQTADQRREVHVAKRLAQGRVLLALGFGGGGRLLGFLLLLLAQGRGLLGFGLGGVLLGLLLLLAFLLGFRLLRGCLQLLQLFRGRLLPAFGVLDLTSIELFIFGA